ncbi:hypothetical protein R3P38DRAFT_3191864 [Favolaschia claudopus]|uniref:Uncharacterized protein n=1 Tax=Favolaschia claudopus TaxID=2862362 RepID=A0AAW0BK41_9AGAR
MHFTLPATRFPQFNSRWDVGYHSSLADLIRNNVTAAIYQAATDGGTLELRGGSIDELAEAYIASAREAAARRDFLPLLRVRHCIVGPDGEISSFGSGIEAEAIHKALDRFLSESARYCTAVDEDRLSLGISVPMSMRFGVTSAWLDDLWVFGAMLSLSLICGHGIGNISPALIQYCLNQCNLESLTPSVISSWHPSLDRAACQLQAVGFGGNLTPFQDRILPALVDRNQNMHNLLVRQVIHTGAIGPEIHGHVETVPFAEGVELPCSNGFSFGKQFAHSFPGVLSFSLHTTGPLRLRLSRTSHAYYCALTVRSCFTIRFSRM